MLKLIRKLIVQVVWFAAAMLMLFGAVSAPANEPHLVVLYPEMREPYRTIFNSILDGIRENAEGQILALPLAKTVKPEKIKNWISAKNPEVVISLGNRGKVIARQLRVDYPVVIGATILSDANISEGLAGVSLTPSPERLFLQLRKLAPKVKNIRVVYHSQTNHWLIEEARQAAENLGLNLYAVPATGVRDAALRYRAMLEKSENGNDAFWLLQGDPTLDERGLLPTILSQAWEKNLLVFSSNPSHVQRGALFSLFPDNNRLGQRLAEKARQAVSGMDIGVETMQDLRIAVNVRTAEHLNLSISRADKRSFDLVFPQK